MIKILIFLLLNSLNVFAQNQVINKKFDWKVYKTEHFDIYFYNDSKELVDYASFVLEKAYEKGKNEYNPLLDKRIPFFLFASINDMEQSSITDVGDGTGGLTEPYKDRFMVYNDGSKRWLRDVIFHEFGHEIQFSILIDSWWESPRILKTILYPLWTMEGMSENMTGEWDIAMEDMYVRDSVVDNKLIPLIKLFGFGHLKPHQTTLVYKTSSKAMRFLSEEYGKDKPSIFFHYYKDSYDINSVLEKTIGLNLENFNDKFKMWLELKYYNQIKDENLFEAEKYGKKITYSLDDDIPTFNVSPVVISNNKIAYISTILGHPPSIVIENIIKKEKKILKYTDLDIDNIPYSRFTMPIRSLSISNNKRYLVFSAQKNHKEYLCIYDIEKDFFHKVLFKDLIEARQFSFSYDDKKLIFVGMEKGINNIYEVEFSKAIEKKELSIKDIKKLTDDDKDKLSPYYAGKKIFYVCENGKFDDIKNDLCVVEGGKTQKIDLGLDILDMYYDDKNNLIYFISDNDKIYNLYLLDLNTNKIYKQTNVIGGVFTPYVSDENIYFSYFKHGSMNIYSSEQSYLDWKYIGDANIKEIKDNYKKQAQIDFQDYKFKFSTDLFFPALLYSSPGGLFLFNYYQASDYLGYHNLSTYINYNSAYPYLNTQITYLYNRYRTKFITSNSIYNVSNIEDDELNVEYKKKYFKGISGFIYPFDRYKSVGVYLSYKNDFKKYEPPLNLEYNDRKKGVIFSYLDNKLNGLYLTSVYGYMFNVALSYYDEFMNGNQRYNSLLIDYTRYIPFSRRTTLVNRLFTGFSNGRDTPEFSYGGVGGVRGLMSSYEAKNVCVYNLEYRAPIIDMDYYMYYFFPDFYFKSIYLKLFADNSYSWDLRFKPTISDIKNSVGFGFDVYTFVLQAYRLVLSFDWSFNTKNGSRIMYFYLGPVF